MNRKIMWRSGEFDEIELVYEKAEANEAISKALEQLEVQALAEAKTNVGMLKTDSGTTLTPDKFDVLSDTDKETVIRVLGNAGLAGANTDYKTATITFKLSPLSSKVPACTVFSILNRLEKLDGAFDAVISSKATLELQVPVGGKKGLFQYEMLIMQLYPWLSVREVTISETPQSKPKDPFLEKMAKYTAFATAFDVAKQEMENAIINYTFLMDYKKSDKMTIEKWKTLDENGQFFEVLSLGMFGIVHSHVICVDFAKYIPYCIAIALLFLADSGKLERQLIDAGDGVDVTKFVEALTLLHDCCQKWECTIGSPVHIVIGSKSRDEVADNEKEQQKGNESFLKRLLKKFR